MKRSLLFGLLCSPVGIGFGIFLRMEDWEITHGDGFGLGFESSAGIAAFLAPCFIWYIMIERRGRISLSRGITVGALSAALAHYICWYMLLLSRYMEHLYLGESIAYVIDHLLRILAAFTYSLVSLPLFGLVTLPIGGLIGGICGRIFKKEESV